MIGISWWHREALSTLAKEITPSFECTLTHVHNERLLLRAEKQPAAAAAAAAARQDGLSTRPLQLWLCSSVTERRRSISRTLAWR